MALKKVLISVLLCLFALGSSGQECEGLLLAPIKVAAKPWTLYGNDSISLSEIHACFELTHVIPCEGVEANPKVNLHIDDQATPEVFSKLRNVTITVQDKTKYCTTISPCQIFPLLNATHHYENLGFSLDFTASLKGAEANLTSTEIDSTVTIEKKDGKAVIKGKAPETMIDVEYFELSESGHPISCRKAEPTPDPNSTTSGDGVTSKTSSAHIAFAATAVAGLALLVARV